MASYIRYLFDYWQRIKLEGFREAVVVASYNAGQGRVRRTLTDGAWAFDTLPRETKGYVFKVLSFRASFLFEAIERGAKDGKTGSKGPARDR